MNSPNVQNLSVQMDGGLMDPICTLIWIVQMDEGPIDPLYYVNLVRPNERQSNGPPILRLLVLSKWSGVQFTPILCYF